MEAQRIFKGRGEVTRNLRKNYLYVLKPEGRDSVKIDGVHFVRYKERETPRLSYEFLKSNCGRAFFSKEMAEALKDREIKPPDVMPSVRRLGRKGLVYVRGYRSGSRKTPFKEGFLITWIDPSKPRELAMEEAVERTECTLMEKVASSLLMQRIRMVRDLALLVLERDLPSGLSDQPHTFPSTSSSE